MNSSPRPKADIRKTVGLLVIFILLVVAGFVWRIAQPVVLTDQELRANGAILLNTPRRFSDFNLLDHKGQPFTRQQLMGHWSILFFGFTHCPDVCPTTMATLNKMYSQLDEEDRRDLQVIMVTLDAERDDVAKIAEYVPWFNPAFIGVTGDEAQIKRLALELNVASSKVALDGGGYTVDHSTQLVLINPRGDYHGFFKAPHNEVVLRTTWRSIRAAFDD